MRFTDCASSINALAKACRSGNFNYYIAVEDENGVVHEVYKFDEDSKIDKNFKKMKGIKEREDGH